MRLQKEFEQIDINRDGLVSLEELQEFLDRKVRMGESEVYIV